MRYNIQMLLIASGYLDAASNNDYNTRLYDAIAAFQTQNGFPLTGLVSSLDFSRLQGLADSHLSRCDSNAHCIPIQGRHCGFRWDSG
jgi:hypothetical protein